MPNTNNMNNQDNMSSPEIRTPIVMFPEKGNLADAKDSYFKVAMMNMYKEPKDDMNKRLKTAKHK